MNTDPHITPSSLSQKLDQFWQLATRKVLLIEDEYDTGQGSPVFTVEGKYLTRGWTEWTQGFQYGIPLLVFAATGNREMLETGKKNTFEKMAHHVTHFGVHDHGFNNLSTYGNLLRCAQAGLFKASTEEKEFFHRQDRARHFAFRRADMSYLICDEELLGLEDYLEKLKDYMVFAQKTWMTN